MRQGQRRIAERSTGVARTTLAWPGPSQLGDPHSGARRVLAADGLGPGPYGTGSGMLLRCFEKAEIQGLQEPDISALR